MRRAPVPSRHAEELGIETKEWTYGPTNFGGETLFYPAYRETLRLLKRGIEPVNNYSLSALEGGEDNPFTRSSRVNPEGPIAESDWPGCR